VNKAGQNRNIKTGEKKALKMWQISSTREKPLHIPISRN
jgi:hypothetical protein